MLQRPKIVAELSANHNQDLNLAKESLHAIKESGAGFCQAPNLHAKLHDFKL